MSYYVPHWQVSSSTPLMFPYPCFDPYLVASHRADTRFVVIARLDFSLTLPVLSSYVQFCTKTSFRVTVSVVFVLYSYFPCCFRTRAAAESQSAAFRASGPPETAVFTFDQPLGSHKVCSLTFRCRLSFLDRDSVHRRPQFDHCWVSGDRHCKT